MWDSFFGVIVQEKEKQPYGLCFFFFLSFRNVNIECVVNAWSGGMVRHPTAISSQIDSFYVLFLFGSGCKNSSRFLYCKTFLVSVLGSVFLFLCVHSAFDLVNIHLFHDASNLVAWENSPSVYSGTRQKALGYVLDR